LLKKYFCSFLAKFEKNTVLNLSNSLTTKIHDLALLTSGGIFNAAQEYVIKVGRGLDSFRDLGRPKICYTRKA